MLLEKMMVTQVVKKFLVFYRTGRFIALLIKICNGLYSEPA
jgi:hypothetical protein